MRANSGLMSDTPGKAEQLARIDHRTLAQD